MCTCLAPTESTHIGHKSHPTAKSYISYSTTSKLVQTLKLRWSGALRLLTPESDEPKTNQRNDTYPPPLDFSVFQVTFTTGLQPTISFLRVLITAPVMSLTPPPSTTAFFRRRTVFKYEQRAARNYAPFGALHHFER
jgi:hypothetical protein